MTRAVVRLLIRTYPPFIALTSLWYFFALTVADLNFGLATFAYVVVIMISANVYYMIESYLSTSKSYMRSALDAIVNLILLISGFGILALFLGRQLSMSLALLLAGLLSFLHPVLTDIPHIKRVLRTSVSTVVPYVCVPIDWTLTLLCVLAFALES